MYDWPEIAWAHDALWGAIAERLNAEGIEAPAALERSRDAAAVWRHPGLVLSQICGFPAATGFRDSVRLVATPVYRVEGCEGPCYSSHIVTRKEEQGRTLADFTGRRFAVNLPDSLSGQVALVVAMQQEGLEPDDVEWIGTGGHRASIRAVAEGRADLAAIDAVCWELAQRFEAVSVSRLQVIAQTPLRPAPPFVTCLARSPAELDCLRNALSGALLDEETAAAREALRIDGVAMLRSADYQPLAELRR